MSKSPPFSTTSISSYSQDEQLADKANKKGDGAKSAVIPASVQRHPLQHAWTLWYFKNDRANTWSENQKRIISVQTVEDFWAVMNHIELSSKLHSGCDYSLFKEGIKPMWEDDMNKLGGRWLISLDKRQRSNSLDNFWLEVMLALIGEAFGEHGFLVNGAVVSVRNKGDKIGIWLGDSSKAESIMEVGRMIKERLAINPSITLAFETHNDTMRSGGSGTKGRFLV